MKTKVINMTTPTMADVEALDLARLTATLLVFSGMLAVGVAGTVWHGVGRPHLAVQLATPLAWALVLMCMNGLHQLRDEHGRRVDLMSWPAAFLTAGGGIAAGVIIGLVLLHIGL